MDTNHEQDAMKSAKPDTFCGVEIMVVLRQRHFQLVRVVA